MNFPGMGLIKKWAADAEHLGRLNEAFFARKADLGIAESARQLQYDDTGFIRDGFPSYGTY